MQAARDRYSQAKRARADYTTKNERGGGEEIDMSYKRDRDRHRQKEQTKTENERERDRETDRQTDRDRDRDAIR